MVEEYQYRKKIMDLQKELKQEKEENQRKDNVINQITNSRSWKITAPLRKLNSKTIKNVSKEDGSEEDFSYDYHSLEPYISEYQEDIDFSNFEPYVKTIAFYLPQYYSFKENDEWWGKDFTEWTNTKKSKAIFEGHYMPREPHQDFGYYNLTDVDTIKKQVQLAKKHQIYGFAYYYYWFSEKRLLEKPLDLLLAHPEIDFPFVLCWANENWTRTWDGLDKEVLIAQKYREDDPDLFIRDLKKYFDDKRYIRIDGKPLLLIYNPREIPDFAGVCQKWRTAAVKYGIGQIVIWSKTAIGLEDYRNVPIVDGEYDFAPQGFILPKDKITGIEKASNVVNYTKLIDNLEDTYNNHYPLKPFSYSVTMGWDNTARRQNNFTIYYHYSLRAFYMWTTMTMKKMDQNNFRNTFLFVNAWNEWAEGTYLEPDKKYGYANINTLSKAICKLPFDAKLKVSKDALKSSKKEVVIKDK